MLKTISYWILSIAMICLVWACIDKIELQPTNPVERLVIFGSIENYDKPYEVRITRTGAFNGGLDNTVTNAEVTLIDINGEEAEMTHQGEGIYRTDAKAVVKGEVGGTYKIQVNLNGEIYESTPETILPSPPIDSVTFLTQRSQFRNDQGFITNKEEFILFSHFKILEEDTWLRWEIENIYLVAEIYCGPFDPVEICYVKREEETTFDVPIWDGNLSGVSSSITTQIQIRDIDVIFGQPQYFNVYQRRIDKETFEYWQKINRVIQDGETIFSIPPSSVPGNIRNINNPDEEVLGIFEAVSVDTARVFTIPQYLNLGRTLNGICGVPGFFRRPLPRECCVCRVLPNSTTVKPEWWD